MNHRQIKESNVVGWHRDSDGYLTDCKYCGRCIYLHCDSDGRWRPYESWAAGTVDEGEWVLHDCYGSYR